MKRLMLAVFGTLIIYACATQREVKLNELSDVERIIKNLSADEMQGRATFSPGIEKAAAFIENEFKQIGLKSLSNESSFRQQFTMRVIKPGSQTVILNDSPVDPENIIVLSDRAKINWAANDAKIIQIKPGETFFDRYRRILQTEINALVLVDEQYADAFKRLRENSRLQRIAGDRDETTAIVFVLTDEESLSSYSISATNFIEDAPLFNIAGILKGKTKPDEYVIFSAHYDHMGILKPVAGDSIANGADDDASGITAVITLAKHFKKLNNNERSLIFVAFTAEEIGGFGSKYFSERLNPDQVVAMFNIEMIGKDSKFGPNTAFITGYDRSDFGSILQQNLEGSAFKFYPDPYPEQDLFYRSDNATLAALGVPAHTISTDQIDNDKLYHTVDDEFESLNMENIYATIQAIALSSRSIVSGTDTPRRIPRTQLYGK
ncbi:MAG TPA: M20/M25/M40 family metallo-hydrolase [Sphingobacteriaceae bacterium]